MQTIVVQGVYEKASYERIKKFAQEAKNRSWEVIYVNENTNIEATLISKSIFDSPKLVLIEDYKLLDKKTLTYLKKVKDNQITLIIYHKGTLPRDFATKLPNLKKTETYDPPKVIFKFLESFYPGNYISTLAFLKEVIKNDPIELVFHLLAIQLRDLLWVKIDPSTVPYASWRVAKLEAQAVKFSDTKLKGIIKKMADLDIKTKTGKKDLSTSLDLLIASNLK